MSLDDSFGDEMLLLSDLFESSSRFRFESSSSSSPGLSYETSGWCVGDSVVVGEGDSSTLSGEESIVVISRSLFRLLLFSDAVGVCFRVGLIVRTGVSFRFDRVGDPLLPVWAGEGVTEPLSDLSAFNNLNLSRPSSTCRQSLMLTFSRSS